MIALEFAIRFAGTGRLGIPSTEYIDGSPADPLDILEDLAFDGGELLDGVELVCREPGGEWVPISLDSARANRDERIAA